MIYSPGQSEVRVAKRVLFVDRQTDRLINISVSRLSLGVSRQPQQSGWYDLWKTIDSAYGEIGESGGGGGLREQYRQRANGLRLCRSPACLNLLQQFLAGCRDVLQPPTYISPDRAFSLPRTCALSRVREACALAIATSAAAARIGNRPAKRFIASRVTFSLRGHFIPRESVDCPVPKYRRLITARERTNIYTYIYRAPFL